MGRVCTKVILEVTDFGEGRIAKTLCLCKDIRCFVFIRQEGRQAYQFNASHAPAFFAVNVSI